MVHIYDVAFIDGSCISLFDGCDNLSDFFFTDIDSGHAANLALLEQVLIDSSAGAFDSNPELTNGCGFISLCGIRSPIGDIFPSSTKVNIVGLINYSGIITDLGTERGAEFRSKDYSPIPAAVDINTYAVWSGANVSQVPIPGSLWLFFSGLIGLFTISKKRQSHNTPDLRN